MDIKAAKDAVQLTIRRLPRDFVLDIAASFARHKDEILSVFPTIIEELKPHVITAGFDFSMGTLDMKGLEDAGKELLAEFISVDLDTSTRPDPTDAENGYVPENR